jgi:hypothetical protein
LSKEDVVSKTFRICEPDHLFLMPASLREWLSPDDLACFISDVAHDPSLSAIAS